MQIITKTMPLIKFLSIMSFILFVFFISSCVLPGQNEENNTTNNPVNTSDSQSSASSSINYEIKSNIRHYVSGNFYNDNTYRFVELPTVSGNIIKLMVGLEYNGGSDCYFNSSVTTTYGLNLIRWYEFTTSNGKNYTNNTDTTVIMEYRRIKVKSAEFSATTSKERLAIKRIIALEFYTENSNYSYNINNLHIVKGNLYPGNPYLTCPLSFPVGSMVKKVVIGLDYTGGYDSFFVQSVTPAYNLNLIRWYTLSTIDGINFTSNIDDTVAFLNNNLKISKFEFSSTTSKEALTLRRVLFFGTYDMNTAGKNIHKKKNFFDNLVMIFKKIFKIK